MSKILDWIKKHVWQTILIGFGLFVLPLIIVHVAYRIPAVSPWFASTWQAGELITYIAGFEAFIGTVVLGAVAVRQNDKANELSERVFRVEEESNLFAHYPNLVITQRDINLATYKELLNEKEEAIFSSIKDIDMFESDDDNWESVFFFFPFSIQNLSSFNVRIQVASFVLEGLFNTNIKYNYVKKPINMKPENSVIAPNCVLGIGFLIEDAPIIKNHILAGKMDISVINYLKEEFFYTIKFEALIKDDNSCGLFITGQDDYRLIKLEN